MNVLETHASRLEKLLACPLCGHPLKIQDEKIICSNSDFTSEIRDGVLMTLQQTSFFDDKYEVMQKGHATNEDTHICYQRQVAYLEKFLNESVSEEMVVLDIGCGPALPYRFPEKTFVIGLEPSFPAIHANHDIHLKIAGSATAIPLAHQSVDTIICFYSIHHMTGKTLKENQEILSKVFREFQRVIKPNGSIFVFEVSPVFPFNFLQKIFWNLAKIILRKKLDMQFWNAQDMSKIGQKEMPNARLKDVSFKTSPFEIFPLAFSLPWLKIFRFMFPFDFKLYRWSFS